VSCEVYRPGLTDVALGLAAPPALEAHLRACASCRALLDEDRRLLGRIDGEVEAALQVAPSAGFLPRVRQRVEEVPAVRGRWRWWVVPAMAAAGAAWLLLRRPPPVPVVAPPAPVVAEVTPPPVSLPIPPAPVRHAARAPRVAEPEVLVPLAEREAFARYVADLERHQRALAGPPTLGTPADSASAEMPPNTLAPLPAPPEIAMGPIQIALIGVQPLTMDSPNEE
jgi:hypothetical protein